MKQNAKRLTDYPDLMLDWDQSLNKDIHPSDITSGSHKEYLWKCHKCGRIWKAPVNRRVSGIGCPCDSKERRTQNLRKHLIARDGSLAETRPDIAAQWHPTLNGNLTPANITTKSTYKAWWQDDSGAVWQSSVSVRCRSHNTAKRPQNLVVPGINDLLTLRPDLAKEWDYDANNSIDIHSVMPGSKKKVWWICSKGHKWQASLISRNSGRGCPICSQERSTSFPEQALFYYISKVFPETINRYAPTKNMETDIFIPSHNIAIEYDGGYYHNSKNKIEQDARKNQRLAELGITLIRVVEDGANAPAGTPYIIPCKRKNSVALIDDSIKELIPLLSKLTKQVINLDIDSVRDQANINEQYIKGEKTNSIASLLPEIVSEWHPTKNGQITPDLVSTMSNKVIWWKCKKCGHEWKAPAYRRARGNGCPVCSGHIVVAGLNDLLTVRPDLEVEWDYARNKDIDPSRYSASSSKKVWWICKKCSCEYQAMISNKTRYKSCPYCSGKKICIGKNDLQSQYPNLAKEWNFGKNGETLPTAVTPGSNKKVWWKCPKCKGEWEAVIWSRVHGRGCPFCAGIKSTKQ